MLTIIAVVITLVALEGYSTSVQAKVRCHDQAAQFAKEKITTEYEEFVDVEENAPPRNTYQKAYEACLAGNPL